MERKVALLFDLLTVGKGSWRSLWSVKTSHAGQRLSETSMYFYRKYKDISTHWTNTYTVYFDLNLGYPASWVRSSIGKSDRPTQNIPIFINIFAVPQPQSFLFWHCGQHRSARMQKMVEENFTKMDIIFTEPGRAGWKCGSFILKEDRDGNILLCCFASGSQSWERWKALTIFTMMWKGSFSLPRCTNLRLKHLTVRYYRVK